MPEAFNRKYSLTICKNQEIVKNIIPEYASKGYEYKKTFPNFDQVVSNIANPFYALTPDAVSAKRSFTVVPPKHIEITELQIEAEFKDNKTASSSMSNNQAEIKIYNLSPSSIHFINQSHSVIVKAGYDNGRVLPVVYVGQIKYVETETLPNVGVVTKIICTATEIIEQIKISKSWPPGISTGELIDDVANIFTTKGIGKGFITSDPIVRGYKYFFGYYMQGDLLEQFRALCNDHNLRAYIRHGKLNVESKQKGELFRFVDIYEDNVIGSIKRQKDNTGTDATIEGQPQGIRITTFLNGEILTGVYLRVNYGKYAGQYEVKSVNHKLDYEGGTWQTEIFADPMKVTE